MSKRYFGNDNLLTSLGNDEIIQQHKPVEETFFKANEIAFYNLADCQIRIDDGDILFLPANFGFSGRDIELFEIITAGVQYTYLLTVSPISHKTKEWGHGWFFN